ncbi:FtsX-like permease family protein [Methylomicrobium lacus]|uniref:ABC transporter permease n=1 Tax=Methylomicrobium lacus TaxID=136992 RepID=UPI0035A833A5
MHTLWNKIWADLWLVKARTALAIGSIAAGVFCVGTLFGMIDLQLAKMDAAHRQSQPSHINLILGNTADNSLLGKIRAVEGVAGIDTMTPLTVRYRLPGKSDWNMGTLIIRPDYSAQQFDRTTLLAGSWPSGKGIAVERLSAEYAGLQIGDRVEVETLNGTQALTLGGIVRHPFVKPPNFGGQLHFFAASALAAEFGLPANTFRQALVNITLPYSTDSVRAVAKDIRVLLAEYKIGVNVTLLQDPDKHWGRPILAGINGVLQIMALASLALACVLIFNTLSAHIAQQTDQIGVMKALGGSTITIAKLYLIETLLMAVAAVALAVPPSLAAAHFSSCRLLNLFNIDCGVFDVSIRAVAFMLLGGLFAPLLAALGPILRGASMTVRVAIASYGLGSGFGTRRFDRWVERIGARFLPTLYAAALGNLFRRKGRLLLTQGVLIIAGAMFLILMSLIASVNLTLDNEMVRSRYAVRLGFTNDQPEPKVTEVAMSVAGSRRVEIWQRLPIDISKGDAALRQQGSLGAQLFALPAATAMYRPLLEQGRWLEAADAGQRVLVLSADTAALNGIKIGDAVDVRLESITQKWKVIGFYRWLAGSNYTVEPVYAPLETVRDITGRGEAASFALLDASIETLAEEADYVRALKQKFEDKQIKLDVYTTQARLEQRRFARNQFNPLIGTLLGLASMIAAVGVIGLSGTLAIGVLQRIREIGVLRAIGAPSKAIFRLFLLEGLLHGIVAWALSVPLAFLAAEPIAGELGKTMLGMQLDYAFDLVAVVYWLVIVIALSWLASSWPAHKAANLTIRECLGH